MLPDLVKQNLKIMWWDPTAWSFTRCIKINYVFPSQLISNSDTSTADTEVSVEAGHCASAKLYAPA